MHGRRPGHRCKRFFLCALAVGSVSGSSAMGQVISLASEGFIYGKRFVAVGYDVQQVLPSRSDEPWFPDLQLTVFQPPQLRPEGLALKNGLLYVAGDWRETQNQIGVFTTNFWGDLVFDHAIEIPLSTPPPTTAPNNEWWGPEGMTFNAGAAGVGAGGSLLVTVDSEQAAVGGNTLATVDPVTGALASFGIVPTPDDIAYGPVSQQFYLKVPPNLIQVFDAQMAPTGLSWTTPRAARGVTVVSEAYGRWLTGDNTLTGDVILVVCKEDPNALPPLVSRLVAYTSGGVQIGTVQEIAWVNAAIDNSSNSGQEVGPHEMEAIVVDEVNNTIYIGDEAARGVYVVKPTSPATDQTSGPVFGRTWNARGQFTEDDVPSRSAEPWFASLAAQMNDPPNLRPEGMVFKDGLLYVSGDWNETQNQIAVYQAPGNGTLSFSSSISLPVSSPPPDPAAAQNELWGPEGLTFNTGGSGYGAGGQALITVEDEQFALFGNTRALLNPMTAALSGFGTFTSFVGATSPDDVAYGPLSTNLYVIADPNVLQVWTSGDPPAFTGTQFAVALRSKGLTVISPSFARFLLQDPTITEEVLLVVAKAQVGSESTPHNRLAAYSTAGILLAEQDLFWTRDAFPGQPLQEFEAIAVDEANQVIYIGDEKAGGIFVFTIPSGVTMTTPANLPDAQEGQAYSQVIAASGGMPPYVFSLQSGALPNALTLSADGSFGGAPTQCGAFLFSVEVSDSALPPATDQKTFSLNVMPTGMAGDLDDDGLVRGSDIQAYARARLGAGSDAERCAADLNADLVVDAADDPLFVAALLAP